MNALYDCRRLVLPDLLQRPRGIIGSDAFHGIFDQYDLESLLKSIQGGCFDAYVGCYATDDQSCNILRVQECRQRGWLARVCCSRTARRRKGRVSVHVDIGSLRSNLPISSDRDSIAEKAYLMNEMVSTLLLPWLQSFLDRLLYLAAGSALYLQGIRKEISLDRPY